jgi:hypothetical protein
MIYITLYMLAVMPVDVVFLDQVGKEKVFLRSTVPVIAFY